MAVSAVQWRIQELAKGGANLPKKAPRPWRAPQTVMAPSIFEDQRGPFEASDAQRAHYELRRPVRAAQRASSDAEGRFMSSEGPSGGQ